MGLLIYYLFTEDLGRLRLLETLEDSNFESEAEQKTSRSKSTKNVVDFVYTTSDDEDIAPVVAIPKSVASFIENTNLTSPRSSNLSKDLFSPSGNI